MTSSFADQIEAIVSESGVPWTRDGCGVTRRDTQIVSLVHTDAYLDDSDRHRVLLVGALSGKPDDAEVAISVLRAYATSRRLRNRVALSAIPCANPDGLELGAGPGNGSGGDPSAPSGGYPPEGGYFNHETDPEARYLWRYIGFMAPDYVVEVRAGDGVAWECAGVPSALSDALGAQSMAQDSSLLPALSQGTPNGLGQVPGIRLTAPVADVSTELHKLLSALDGLGAPIVSQARSELASRRSRTPLSVAASLVPRYGDRLDPVIYTQGVSISGRLRYGELTGEADKYAQGVAELVEPYMSGAKPWFADSDGGANHAGLVWCEEMFDVTGDERYRDLLVEIADLYRGNDAGVPPPPCDPDYRTEDFFFSGALMGRAYALTGDASYLDIQTEFLLNAEIQQDDGLFMHCRSVPYYWGRGNGFAALGYAETLTRLPESHPSRDRLIEMHTRHLDALRDLQRPSGMFSQLLDFPGTYQELTAVCMTGYAVARGLRLGWLPARARLGGDESYRDFAESLWRAASERIGTDGSVVDGCTGTGAVNDRRFYIDRAAEYDQDDRTGNLALWFAVEMERLRRASL